MDIPQELPALAARWDELKRWERKELGQALRMLGLSYGEIGKIIPVGKGTLSPWCRDIPLTPEQIERLRTTSGNREAGRARTGAILRQRNLERVAAIRRAGREEAKCLMEDPRWMSGVVAYWAEGAKRTNEVQFSNSDPELIRLFMIWATKYFNLTRDRFTISLHLHEGQDESERAYWSMEAGLLLNQFRKTFWKAEGTGHRKNVLYYGTARIRITRSSDLLHRVLGWIDAIRELECGPLDWDGAVGVIGNVGDS
jgi:hypothetical protein